LDVPRTAHRWGPFRFTPKKATVAEPFGRWQAACCFHRKSDETKCKKSDKVGWTPDSTD
jgi:hypothetical protein